MAPPSWSTCKVPVAMAVITAGAGHAQASDLHAAIMASDNAAAERLRRAAHLPRIARWLVRNVDVDAIPPGSSCG